MASPYSPRETELRQAGRNARRSRMARGSQQQERERFTRAQQVRMRGKGRMSAQGQLPEKKVKGPLWWTALVLAVGKDSLGLLLNISIFLTIFIVPLGLFIGIMISFIFRFMGVNFTIKRIIWMVVRIAAESLPIISIPPWYTAQVLYARFSENRKVAKERKQIMEELKKNKHLNARYA